MLHRDMVNSRKSGKSIAAEGNNCDVPKLPAGSARRMTRSMTAIAEEVSDLFQTYNAAAVAAAHNICNSMGIEL